jgi:hypothetical protein
MVVEVDLARSEILVLYLEGWIVVFPDLEAAEVDDLTGQRLEIEVELIYRGNWGYSIESGQFGSPSLQPLSFSLSLSVGL